MIVTVLRLPWDLRPVVPDLCPIGEPDGVLRRRTLLMAVAWAGLLLLALVALVQPGRQHGLGGIDLVVGVDCT